MQKFFVLFAICFLPFRRLFATRRLLADARWMLLQVTDFKLEQFYLVQEAGHISFLKLAGIFFPSSTASSSRHWGRRGRDWGRRSRYLGAAKKEKDQIKIYLCIYETGKSVPLSPLWARPNFARLLHAIAIASKNCLVIRQAAIIFNSLVEVVVFCDLELSLKISLAKREKRLILSIIVILNANYWE